MRNTSDGDFCLSLTISVIYAILEFIDEMISSSLEALSETEVRTKRRCILKKIWIVLRIVGACVFLYLFLSLEARSGVLSPEINKARADVGQAWDNIERTVPLLAEKYDRATKKQQEVTANFSPDPLHFFLLFPMAFFLSSLLWEFVLDPLAWMGLSLPHSLGGS